MRARQIPKSSTRVLIQRAKDGLFYRPAGWTEDPQSASGFSDTVTAFEIINAMRLENVQLVLQLPGQDRRFDVTIPLRGDAPSIEPVRLRSA